MKIMKLDYLRLIKETFQIPDADYKVPSSIIINMFDAM